MKMMRIMVKNAIKIVLFVEGLILLTRLYSFEAFINTQVAAATAFFVIVGASFGYRSMVNKKLQSGEYEDQRDLLDTIDDPHELYDEKEINGSAPEDLDLKAIVKEEKAKIKTFSLKSAKHGAKGSFSVVRLVAYVVLVLGFIALKNNQLLHLEFYLPALLIGIVGGSLVVKETLS